MPTCAETNRAMQELTGVKSNSGEQNNDMSKARRKRGAKDTLAILTTFADRDPFSADPNLRNIMTGVNADNAVNVDRARAIGEKILSSMTRKSATDYTFKRSSQAVSATYCCLQQVRWFTGFVPLWTVQLSGGFVRFFSDAEAAAKTSSCWCYMSKAVIQCHFRTRRRHWACAGWRSFTPSNPVASRVGNLSGYLWIILQLCDQKVRKSYRRVWWLRRHVYKNMTHQRRAAGKAGATVTFIENMKVTLKKDNFLANPKNKQRFINMLSHFLQEDNCPTYHAEGDADVLIVKTAVESARERNTVLVGDDTDLLVMLCFDTRSDGFDLYFKPEPKANSRRRV